MSSDAKCSCFQRCKLLLNLSKHQNYRSAVAHHGNTNISLQSSQSCKEVVRLLVHTPLQHTEFHFKRQKNKQYHRDMSDLRGKEKTQERQVAYICCKHSVHHESCMSAYEQTCMTQTAADSSSSSAVVGVFNMCILSAIYILSHVQFLLRVGNLCTLFCVADRYFWKSEGRILHFLPSVLPNSSQKLKEEGRKACLVFS